MVLEEVVGHGQARLDRAHHLAEGLGRGVDLGPHLQRGFRRETELADQVGHRDEALVNRDVRVLAYSLNHLFG